VASSPAVGDVDGDGKNEVVVGAGSLDVNSQQGGIMVFNRDGTTRCSFKPAALPDLRSTAVFNAPALGDVDGDGINDIVFGAFNQSIYVINGNCAEKARFNNTDSVWSAPALYDIDHGSDVAGWPKKATYTTFLAAPALGDIDGDGKTDVVVGSTDYKASPLQGAVDAFLGNGRMLTRKYADEIVSPPVIADTTGQG